MRIVPVPLVALPLLVGCGPVFKIKDGEQTCPHPIFEWSGGLTRHVLQGNGNGEFDWDPPDPGVARASGSYDLKSGVIDYVVEYDAGNARIRDTITGAGTLWPDGDMDIGYSVSTAWADGVASTLTVREQRFGCDLSERFDDDGEVSFRYGTYDADGLAFTREFAIGKNVLVASGRAESTFAHSEVVDFAGGGFELSYDQLGDADGQVVRAFVDKFDDVTVRGEWTRQLTGVTAYDYKVNDQLSNVENWAFTLDLEGTGTGEVDLGSKVCPLEITAFACEKVSCGRDFNGPCTLPLIEPRS